MTTLVIVRDHTDHYDRFCEGVMSERLREAYERKEEMRDLWEIVKTIARRQPVRIVENRTFIDKGIRCYGFPTIVKNCRFIRCGIAVW